MIWSLNDKGDLNPKKFAREASGIAKLLIAGDISIKPLLEKRRQTLINLEASKTQRYQYEEGFRYLLDGMKFDSPKYKDAFLKELEKARLRPRMESSGHFILYDSVQYVLSNWPNASKVHLDDDCIFAATSKEEFDILFSQMLTELIQDPIAAEKRMKTERYKKSNSEVKNDKLFQKYYVHPTAREGYLEKGNVYAQKLLDSVLTLYEESHRCWRCNRLHGEGIETKALICASCQCAVYCCKECQVQHWKEGGHINCCKNTAEIWYTYTSRKKLVGRAIRKGRIFTKPITVDGIEKECFIRPCESLDHILCASISEINGDASIDVFYKNIAILACGGKHLLFGKDTISSELEEKIRLCYEDVISEIDPETLKEHEGRFMESFLPKLMYPETTLTKDNVISSRSDLSVDRFITLYICWERLDLHRQFAVDKFKIEMFAFQQIKKPLALDR